jgi:hypothetical protein
LKEDEDTINGAAFLLSGKWMGLFMTMIVIMMSTLVSL